MKLIPLSKELWAHERKDLVRQIIAKNDANSNLLVKVMDLEARVKELTEALELVLPEWESDFESVSIEMGLSSVRIEENETYIRARKALTGSTEEDK
jgi:hypothetical protein